MKCPNHSYCNGAAVQLIVATFNIVTAARFDNSADHDWPLVGQAYQHGQHIGDTLTKIVSHIYNKTFDLMFWRLALSLTLMSPCV